MQRKFFLVILIALVLGGAVLGIFWNVVRATIAGNEPVIEKNEQSVRTLEEPSITFVDQILGPKDAEVTIVEFGDYLCPYCRTSEDQVRRLLAEQPGRVRFVWKDMPSPLHPDADTAAEAGMCAGKQGAFWEFHTALFAHTGSYNETALTFLAGQSGLDAQAFAECLQSHDMRPFVERTIDEGLALGIDALPTFFINGKRHTGNLTYEELLEAAR
ncbi:MAG: thioredoxin domain-containing protein [Patescibacteria group bacterium]|nr:MAG: thioredoxin domain-containing protein [Patescibacteria group bacterium]